MVGLTMDPKATATVTSLLYGLEWDVVRLFPAAMIAQKHTRRGAQTIWEAANSEQPSMGETSHKSRMKAGAITLNVMLCSASRRGS